jgi:hypothetical protein
MAKQKSENDSKVATKEDLMMRLHYKTVTFDHDGWCSESECDAVEGETYKDIEIPDKLTGKYQLGDEVPEKKISKNLRKYREKLTEGGVYCGVTDKAMNEYYEDFERHSKVYVLNKAIIISRDMHD